MTTFGHLKILTLKNEKIILTSLEHEDQKNTISNVFRMLRVHKDIPEYYLLNRCHLNLIVQCVQIVHDNIIEAYYEADIFLSFCMLEREEDIDKLMIKIKQVAYRYVGLISNYDDDDEKYCAYLKTLEGYVHLVKIGAMSFITVRLKWNEILQNKISLSIKILCTIRYTK